MQYFCLLSMLIIDYNKSAMHFLLSGDEMKCYFHSKPNEKDTVRHKISEVSGVAPIHSMEMVNGHTE